jgi:hypothetical protein
MARKIVEVGQVKISDFLHCKNKQVNPLVADMLKDHNLLFYILVVNESYTVISNYLPFNK